MGILVVGVLVGVFVGLENVGETLGKVVGDREGRNVGEREGKVVGVVDGRLVVGEKVVGERVDGAIVLATVGEFDPQPTWSTKRRRDQK